MFDPLGDLIMNDVQWFDGKSAAGKYVLEMHYTKGAIAYLKNACKQEILKYLDMMLECPEIVGITLYDPQKNVISNNFKKMAA